MRYKVRFHLAKGKNYMNWQVAGHGSVFYFDPIQTQLILHNCSLYNNSKISNKIFNGTNKIVCAWVYCEDFQLNPYSLEICTDSLKNIRYNPRINPNWILDGKNIDGMNFSCLVTKYNKLYVK